MPELHSAAVAMVTSAAALAASLLIVAPASAATASLTAASCQASGGTYSFSKGVKTCTTLSDVSYTDYDEGRGKSTATDTGNYTATYTVRVDTSYKLRTTQTQKGKGQILTAVDFLSETVVQTSAVVAESRTCSVEGVEEPVDVSVCDDLGLYTL